jgi:hypothetical protein
MEQPKTYTIKQFKVGDFTDQNGNKWCDILFDEYASEPMRIVVKDPSQYTVGQKLYGHIETKESKAGKPYQRFYRDKQPDFHGGSSGGSAPAGKSSYVPKDEGLIMAQWALGRTYEKHGATPEALKDAKWLMRHIEEIKASKDEIQPTKRLDASPDPMNAVFNPDEYQGGTTDLPPGW